MTSIISKFEHLPNEILLDLLSYCRPRDLFISLFNLNQRLNSLISFQTLNIDLGNALPKYLLDIYYKSILPHAHQQIDSLRLSDTYGRLNRFVFSMKYIDIDFSTRICILNRVKYLILWDPLMSSLHEILEYVPNLEYCQVTSIGRARHTPNYSENLLKKLFAMTKLKRLYLALHDSVLFTDDIEINRTITHLNLNGCYMQHLAPLLRRLPNLRRLNIMCYNRPNIFSINQNNFDQTLYEDLAQWIPHLTHLALHVTHTPFYEIEYLLRQLKTLIKFSFSSLLIEDYSNGQTWQRIITDYLPNLKKFSLFINETHIPARTQIDLKRIIDTFSDPFWKRWPVVVDYYIESITKRHIMLYTLPSQRDSLRTYLYGVESQSSRNLLFNSNVDNNQMKSDYKQVYELHLTLHTNPQTKTILTDRIYANLKSLAFSSDLTDANVYNSDNLLNDLQQMCPTDVLANIKRIYLYNEIYPIDFCSKLLNLLPNIQSLRLPACALHLSTILTRVTSLTIDFNINESYKLPNTLKQISRYFPNIRYLYYDLQTTRDIYILLIYSLRKLTHLLDIHVTLAQTSTSIDQMDFIRWFTDFKSLSGLNQRVQVEFGDDDKRLHISL